MTLSSDDRNENIRLALRLFLLELPESRPYEWEEVHGDKEPFLDILPTTWTGLVRKGYVKDRGYNRYELTGPGWISALRITGLFNNKEFKEKAGKLRAALRTYAGDRRTNGRISRTELQSTTGLSEAFIYNAIDSHLLRHLFHIQDADWADEMKTPVDVPNDFGISLG